MKRAAILAGVGVVAASAAAFAVFETFPPPGAARPGPAPASGVGAVAVAGASAGNVDRGEAVFRTCSACHTIGQNGPDVDGPNLYGAAGARIAARRPRYGYTQALRDVGGRWTEARLDAWLTDPAAFAPGTAMHFPGLPDARDRADVIAYLSAHGPAR